MCIRDRFINLTAGEHAILCGLINHPTSLNKFFTRHHYTLTQLGDRIFFILKMLATLDAEHVIYISPPFTYRPYINMLEKFYDLNHKRIFPIGDSIFCGNPKVGNGLSWHLNFINILIQNLDNHF